MARSTHWWLGVISWLGWISWLGGIYLRPLTFVLEFVATFFVSVRHASLHIALICLVNSNALELDIGDWWFAWVGVWISWSLAISFVPHAL
jgi:hypothetical protein